MFIQEKALPAGRQTFPGILVFSQLKYYFFSAVFTGLAVSVPWLTHQFGLAGQIFLPMHLFILAAGFLFGWRTGLLVGVVSPLISYSLTQMPQAMLLPQVVVELAIYGLVIGLLREKKVNLWVSLLSAMVLGRVARIFLILAFFPRMDAVSFVQISLPGIILQILLVPLAVYLVQKFILGKNNG